MKNNNKLTIILLFLIGFSFTACDDAFDLNLQDDPNEITEAQTDRLMTKIQIDLGTFAYRTGQIGAELTRIEQMQNKIYLTSYSADDFWNQRSWRLAYQNMYSDLVIAENAVTASESGNNKLLGMINVIKAYTMMTAVDLWGDVPYSEAGNSADFPFPNVDDGASVYAASIELLDAAIVLLQDEGTLYTDLYYDGDVSKWTKLANTLKMNAYVNTRLVDGDAVAKFNAIVAGGNFISSTADDFQFKHGTSPTQPDMRHRAYQTNYQVTGINGGSYRSNWLMNEMYQSNDPRILYYFYRQNQFTPGAPGVPPNQQELPCSTQPRPQHFPTDMVFCSLEGGYWGRDHGNEEGIPPDGFKRTAVGVYPAGGMFDNSLFTSVGVGLGGGGAGIVPIMLASWVDLMQAEMAMVSSPASGNTFLQASLEKSIAKVMTFSALDPAADSSNFPDTTTVSTFVSNIVSEFDAASDEDKWNLFATQHFIGHYGNGMGSYDFYRRTGYPTTLQYNIEPNPGNFVRSLVYPSDEANSNSNITQKPNVDIKVFWDTNPNSNPNFSGFPAAN